MKYVYGPVHSRRLGRSLGIDPIPLKTCNWNCVYCQLGRSTPLTNERREYHPTEEIEAEISGWLASHDHDTIDWISFVGSGEPTLHSEIGRLIRTVKAQTDVPVAVITNGSLLYLSEVRQALLPADAVMPTVSAGSIKIYRQLHRPHPDITFARLFDGIADFRKEYAGKLWIEVMLVKGINDGDKALRSLALVLERLEPDEIHINTPVRPPSETWVLPPDEPTLLRASGVLGHIAEVFHPVELPNEPAANGEEIEAIVELVSRHPISEKELLRLLEEWRVADPTAFLAKLMATGRVQIVERLGTRFWAGLESNYPDEPHSLRVRP